MIDFILGLALGIGFGASLTYLLFYPEIHR